MAIKRTTRITIDTYRTLVVNRGHRPHPEWCRSCRRQVDTLTPSDAAVSAGVNVRTIYRWVEADAIHSIETPEGFLLVCIDSLLSNTASRPSAKAEPSGGQGGCDDLLHE